MLNRSAAGLILVALAAAAPVPGPSAADVRLLEEGAGRVRLEYRAPAAEMHRPQAWVGYGAGTLVGVPPGAGYRLQIVEKSGARPLEGAAADSLAAAAPATAGDAAYMRHQQVVPVSFGPEKLADGRVVAYDRVVADLHFSGGRTDGRRTRDRLGEEMYRYSLANYEQARGWRAGRRPFAAKAAQAPPVDAVRLTLREDGVYRVSGQDLIDAGIPFSPVPSAGVSVLYAGGRMLPNSDMEPPGGELEPVAVVVEDGGDGTFDADDYVLFYGEGLDRWEYDRAKRNFSYRRNLYTRDNAYWLVLEGSEARRMQRLAGAPDAADAERPGSYLARIHEEEENQILVQTYQINSGYDWFWESFARNARNFSMFLQDVAPGEPARARLRFFGSSDALHPFDFKWNDALLERQSFEGTAPHIFDVEVPGGVEEGRNLLGLVHLNSNGTRLDWFEVEYPRRFVAQRGEIIFDAESTVGGGTVEYRVGGFSRAPRVFKVGAEVDEIVDFAFDAAAGEVVFQAPLTAIPRRFVLAEESRWRRPLALKAGRLGELRRTDRSADYIIVAHGDFIDAARRLAAWRSADDRFGPPLRTVVVDVEQVYADFSGGLVDPAAIRNFVHYAFHNWEAAPVFLGLFGDGSYDYKDNSKSGSRFWIPAFQDGDSAFEEWYGRVAGDDILPDVAVGRFPVQTAAEADALVDKIIAYDSQPEVGPWQGRALLVADDLVNPSEPALIESYFISDAEVTASLFMPPDLDLDKLYIAAFPLEGNSKPRARDEFIRRFNEGALILTYLGHGNPDVLAHEQMFRLSRDFGDIANGRRLPLMYTAASQVGVFDDPQRQSMPEALLLKPDGGVIGMISATRIGFHESNMNLAFQFHEQMYRSGRQHVPVGLALMEAKQLVVNSARISRDRRNIQRYSLMGDPAQRLARPPLHVELDLPDTLRALEEVEIAGRVVDGTGALAAGFNGRARVQVFDSTVSSLLDGYSYQQIGGPLFRGLVDVVDGRFSTLFRLPKDITYRERRGRASAYAWSADGGPAAFGSVRSRVLAGTASEVPLDEEGPDISIAFRERDPFVSGQALPPRAVLRARISDPNGINITGAIGHEIELEVGGQAIRVTDAFISQPGGYREGVLEYQLPALEPGEYTVRLKAWDTFNNSATAEVQAVVKAGGDFALSELLFYPNPMSARGHLTYALGETASSVDIGIYTLSGRLVERLQGSGAAGYNQVEWEPPADLANGTYLVRVLVQRTGGGRVERTAPLQVAR